MQRAKLVQPKINDSKLKPENIDIVKEGKIYDVATNTLHINDIIDSWWGISADDVSNALTEMDSSQPLRVVINSDGGSVYEAIAIHNLLADWESEITTHVSSLAASSASMIAMVGDNRTIADNAKFMIHNPWAVVAGNAVELRAFANMLDQTAEGLVQMYERKSNLSKDEIEDYLKGEEGADGTYFSAEESLEHGFSTEIIDTSRSKTKDSVKGCGKPRLISAKIKLFNIDTKVK
jgi:ATP-dependent Clp protease, protease subunit